MKGSSSIIIFMVEGFINGLIKDSMTVNGKIIKWMARVFSLGVTDECIILNLIILK